MHRHQLFFKPPSPARISTTYHNCATHQPRRALKPPLWTTTDTSAHIHSPPATFPSHRARAQAITAVASH
ncbi:hypothetical protein M0R45_036048 [Rubus argutus]|uniref:Uncharacterized protein n=1 Tax=Rubus argutus TaxID=59490 RepID=A0AAW1VYN2_RUBAR